MISAFSYRLWFAALALCTAADGLAGEPVKPRTPETLIRQLGDSDFRQREAAGRELAQIGEPALPALRAAAVNSPDPEVRRLCERLIRLIIWNVRNSKSSGLAMLPVRADEFLMGSPKTEVYRKDDEAQHRVRITRPFLIGTYEVTQDEYHTVMKTTPSSFSATGSSKEKVVDLKTGRFPVETVSWYDAVEFCNRLSRLDGYEPYYSLAEAKRDGDTITAAKFSINGGNGYRLPTEAEWEYACRAGTTTAFFFGYRSHGEDLNMKSHPAAGGYGGPPVRKSLDRPAIVGSYKPNRFDLFDTHGNVGEWCEDWYAADYYAKSPTDDPPGPKADTHRVVRGGSWLVSEVNGRSASRFWLAPGEAAYHTGFRVARTP